MADGDQNIFDRAEAIARRVLGRLGAKADSKAAAPNHQTLSPREVGALTARIEEEIEKKLAEDSRGIRRVAPNHFEILFIYEISSRLNRQYLQALADELKTDIYEYITNRRYETRGPVEVKTGQDLFAKSTVVKADFKAGEQQRAATDARKVCLRSADGQSYRFELKPGGAPAVIGRSAGCAVRIDDVSLSRLHCSLALRGNGDLVVADLGSSNGTSVNGIPIAPNAAQAVRQGDVITAGDVRLTISEIA